MKEKLTKMTISSLNLREVHEVQCYWPGHCSEMMFVWRTSRQANFSKKELQNQNSYLIWILNNRHAYTVLKLCSVKLIHFTCGNWSKLYYVLFSKYSRYEYAKVNYVHCFYTFLIHIEVLFLSLNKGIVKASLTLFLISTCKVFFCINWTESKKKTVSKCFNKNRTESN